MLSYRLLVIVHARRDRKAEHVSEIAENVKTHAHTSIAAFDSMDALGVCLPTISDRTSSTHALTARGRGPRA